ncbi:unnamed protein product [Brassica oleracea var. botrytis]
MYVCSLFSVVLMDELYVNISWPLYQNMFMLLRFTHTWAPRNLVYGHEVPRVVSSLSEEEQDALMKNIRGEQHHNQ